MTSRVRRTGAAVCRPANFWTPAVHGLLRHLQAAGSPAPQPLGTEGDRELLTWIDGESGSVGWAKVMAAAVLSASASGCGRWSGASAGQDADESPQVRGVALASAERYRGEGDRGDKSLLEYRIAGQPRVIGRACEGKAGEAGP